MVFLKNEKYLYFIEWMQERITIWYDCCCQYQVFIWFCWFLEQQAGISSDQLTLALEPEAASIHCRRQPVGISTEECGKKEIAAMKEGEKYVIFDQGG